MIGWHGPVCGRDRDRGRWFGIFLKRIAGTVRNMHTRSRDKRACGNCARQFSFFGPPVSSIKHLRSGAEAVQCVEQFIPFGIVGRQTFARKRHTQGISLCGFYKNRATPNVICHTPRLKRLDDFARLTRFKARIEQGQTRLGRKICHGKNRRKHPCCS